MMQLWTKLLQYLQGLGPLALAYSGGLDSRFLAHAAQQAGCDVLLLHAKGAHTPAVESAFALAFAQERGFALRCVPVDVCALDGVQDNSKERCYYCKKYLMESFMGVAKAQGRRLCDGTNADDMQAHRPGLRALAEWGVQSPLAELGISKAQVRRMAEETGLAHSGQKASPCLLTRLAYGLRVEPEILARIAAAEEAVLALGVPECRLRLCPEPLLQYSPCAVSATQLTATLATHGFSHAQLCEETQLSGFFDRK